MRISKLPFKVIDVRTGREYSEKAVIKDGYVAVLMEMDLNGFMICEDGFLAFGDECGRYNAVNTFAKYEIEIDGYVAIDRVLEIIKEVRAGCLEGTAYDRGHENACKQIEMLVKALAEGAEHEH